MPVDLDALTVEVIRILSWCEKLGLANQTQDLDDRETIDGYAITLAAHGIDAEMLLEARPRIFSEEFFPRPGTIVKLCESIRDRVLSERKRRYYGSLVECQDDQGCRYLAPRSRVRAGRLLPEGDTSGDGSPAPRALPRQASERARRLADAIIGGDPRTPWGDEKRIGD